MVTGLLVIKFSRVVIFVVEKSDSCFAAIQFCNHSYNYRLNWTPPGLITTMKSLQCRSASVITGQILFYSILLPWIRDYQLVNPIFEGFHIYFFRQVKYVLWIMLRKQIFKTFEVNLSWFLLLLLLFFFSWQYHKQIKEPQQASVVSVCGWQVYYKWKWGQNSLCVW